MLPNERQPQLDRLRMTIQDLDPPAVGNPLEILLRLLVDEIGPGDCPALGLVRQWDGALGGKLCVVGCTKGEITHELQIPHAERTELNVAHGDAVCYPAAEGFEVVGLDRLGKSCISVDLALDFLLVEFLVFFNGDVSGVCTLDDGILQVGHLWLNHTIFGLLDRPVQRLARGEAGEAIELLGSPAGEGGGKRCRGETWGIYGGQRLDVVRAISEWLWHAGEDLEQLAY